MAEKLGGVVPPPICKSTGATESERYLEKLCRTTFLSLWSYLGVYRDQGKKTASSDGKELADLLVVFGDHVIIFSDKLCEFPDGEINVSWGRWFRKAILKSANQIYGAERWIRDDPDKLYLDKTCTQPFPIPLPPLDRMKVHRIAVAHGAAEACKKHFDGGSGSLIVCPEIKGREHYEGDGIEPFYVGLVDPDREYVHVLDDTTLDIILKSLDTVDDFVAYLERKEAFVASGRLKLAMGEEEMLAHYLRHVDADGIHEFHVPTPVNAQAVFERTVVRVPETPRQGAPAS